LPAELRNQLRRAAYLHIFAYGPRVATAYPRILVDMPHIDAAYHRIPVDMRDRQPPIRKSSWIDCLRITTHSRS
jgi:hypothetical protein